MDVTPTLVLSCVARVHGSSVYEHGQVRAALHRLLYRSVERWMRDLCVALRHQLPSSPADDSIDGRNRLTQTIAALFFGASRRVRTVARPARSVDRTSRRHITDSDGRRDRHRRAVRAQ